MKKEKVFVPHKVTIRNRNKGKALTAPNTEILIDGKKLKGVYSFKFEVVAGDIARVNIEMYADFSFEQPIGSLMKQIIRKKK